MRARHLPALATIGVVLGLLAVQVFAPVPRGSMLLDALFDAGHALVFGVIALALLGLLQRWVPAGRPPALAFPAAFLLTTLAGGAAELLQSWLGRDAEVLDLARDALGAAAFLLLRAAWTSASRAACVRRLAVALLLLSVSAAHLVDLAAAHLQRNLAFPHLCTFDARWQRRFVRGRDAELVFCEAPEAWGKPAADRVGRLTLREAAYPALILSEPVSDWSRHARLSFAVFSELDEPVDLVLRIDDDAHDQSYHDRFNRTLRILPGAQTISIPLAEIAAAPRGRTLNLRQVRVLALFAVRPPAPVTLYVDDLRLEP